MAAVRHSKQREAIYQELRSRYDHPTAEELYASLKPGMPNLSLATVYRNLRMLAGQGNVLVLHTEAADHFDANVCPHYHFYCHHCQHIYDVDIPEIAAIDAAAKSLDEGTADGYHLMFTGRCRACSN